MENKHYHLRERDMHLNLDDKSIKKIVKLQIDKMPSWTTESQNLEGTGDTGSCYSMPKYSLYIMRQDPTSVETASNKIKAFINGQGESHEKESN